jgi:selenocysteine-specific elongation factor
MKKAHCVIGTAGHIDHGKTSLVRALTGVVGDRLKEEKRRGVTIDLGFAHMDIPGVGVASIIDAPGHAKFIHNMTAGATGLDAALLVVSADDAVMPQTAEHLAILDILGVNRGVVALTKADLVDDETLRVAVMDVERLIEGSSLQGAKIISCSSVTGLGIAELKQELYRILAVPTTRRADAYFRLPVDRVFIMKGHGTVVTGTANGGTVKVGDRLVFSPGGAEARVRSVQTHGEQTEEGRAGERVALNVSGPEKADVGRGHVIVHPAIAVECQNFIAEVSCHRLSTLPIIHGRSYILHAHTAERICEVFLMAGPQVKCGEKSVAQIRFKGPLNLINGDRFILRSSSASGTVGGGVVLLPGGPMMGRRRMKAREKTFAGLTEAVSGVTALIAENPSGVSSQELGAIFNLPRDPLAQAVAGIPGATMFEAGGETYVYSVAEGDKLITRLKERVEKFHRENPAIAGMEESQLAGAVLPGVSGTVAGRWIRKAVSGGALEYHGSALRVPGRTAVFDDTAERLRKAILAEFQKGGLNPPKPEKIYENAGLKRSDAAKMARSLIERGEIINVSPDLSFHADTFAEAKRRLLGELESAGSVTTARYRDILGTGRKVAIDLLEYFDKAGLTQRMDDKGTRVAKRKPGESG